MTPTDQDSLFDVRLLRARLESGLITREQYAAFLTTLPDDAKQAEPTHTRFAAQWQERHDESNDDEE